MPQVEFHHGIGDKQAYACRLLRKASRAGVQLVVTGDVAALQALDRLLWVFDDQEFLPHVLSTGGVSLPERLHATPVWLSDDPASAPGPRSVLVNLGREVPPGAERFDRLFDLVSSQPDDRQEGRARWKAYAARGWKVRPHDVNEGATP
ncbi:DNA polymerase III subunit chi [Aquabacterium sp.]|uniref:DNA polymerase III subunit chi n=1 Tax=Aquabacterium TaxID=92793 RepID=UPI001DA2BB40|nr:DNA polymerase III subunit chi [Aquabacterium sp.]MBT9608996.1 DNA polymerase III subunit chi [Aquabacterium sp.]|tara:strand:+ start:1031 stop:1477 length:447 start_codon:yes stop_codon:yes gene_type:complete